MRQIDTDLSLGQQSLDDACAICLHEPVKGDDCKINKALRNTIKAFLRKKGIERDQALKKELASRAPTTPANLDNTISNDASNHEASRASVTPAAEYPAKPSVQLPPDACETSVLSNTADGFEQKPDGRASSSEAQMDIPRPSIEVIINTYQFSSDIVLTVRSLGTRIRQRSTAVNKLIVQWSSRITLEKRRRHSRI